MPPSAVTISGPGTVYLGLSVAFTAQTTTKPFPIHSGGLSPSGGDSPLPFHPVSSPHDFNQSV